MMEPCQVQSITANILLNNKLYEKKRNEKIKISFKFWQFQLVFVAIWSRFNPNSCR